jgi:hypothetical protein
MISSVYPSEKASGATSFYGKAPSESKSSSSGDCYTSCDEDETAHEERFIPSKITNLQEVKRISNRIGNIDKSLDLLMDVMELKKNNEKSIGFN